MTYLNQTVHKLCLSITKHYTPLATFNLTNCTLALLSVQHLHVKRDAGSSLPLIEYGRGSKEKMTRPPILGCRRNTCSSCSLPSLFFLSNSIYSASSSLPSLVFHLVLRASLFLGIFHLSYMSATMSLLFFLLPLFLQQFPLSFFLILNPELSLIHI